MRDDDRRAAQRLRAADVIAVVVAVDEVRDRLVAHLGDRLPDARRVGRRRVHDDHAALVGHEHRLVGAVGDHVEAVAELLGPVALRGIDRRALRGLGDVEVAIDADANRRELRHRAIGQAGRLPRPRRRARRRSRRPGSRRLRRAGWRRRSRRVAPRACDESRCHGRSFIGPSRRVSRITGAEVGIGASRSRRCIGRWCRLEAPARRSDGLEQRQREARLVVDPLLPLGEPAGSTSRRMPAGSNLYELSVQIVSPSSSVRRSPAPATTDVLGLEADQVHLDARRVPVPDRAVREAIEREVGVQLGVQPQPAGSC